MDSGIPLDVKPSQPEENRVDNKGPSIRELTASDRPAPRFPAKLWAAVNDSRSDLLTWDRDGTAFMVHEHRFCNEVMTAHPGLVQAAAFNNFRRQLREYQFEWKVNHVTQQFLFQHDCFRRGHPELIGEIQTRRRARAGAVNNYLRPSTSPLDTKDLGWGNRKRSFPLQPVPTGLYAPKLLHPPSYDVTSGSLPPEQRVLMTSDPLTLPPVLPYPHGFTNMSSVATACLSNREPGSTGPQYSWEVQQCQCQECLHQGALRLTAAPSTHATVPKHEDFSSDFLANLVRAAQMSRVDTSHVLSMLMPSTQQPANSPGLPADGSQTTPGHVMISPNWQDPPTGSSSSQGSSQGSL